LQIFRTPPDPIAISLLLADQIVQLDEVPESTCTAATTLELGFGASQNAFTGFRCEKNLSRCAGIHGPIRSSVAITRGGVNMIDAVSATNLAPDLPRPA
jgi:hypothetical protein